MLPYKKQGRLRRLSIFVGCSVLLVVLPHPPLSFGHPAVTLLGLYGLKTERPVYVNPYIVSLLSLYSVHKERHQEDVREFIHWYFSRLNYPDKYGLTGTIYDYSFGGEREVPTGEYDSVDGYAGLFLTLIWAYAKKTGDYAPLEQNRSKIRDMAHLLSLLSDKDGLTVALPKGEVKYLMNNCEAYGGIRAYHMILSLLGEEDETYRALETTMSNGIRRHFYDKRGGNFFWAVSRTKKWESRWDKKYPDAFAQIFPITYSLLEGSSEIEKHLWNTFSFYYGKKIDTFPVEQRLMIEMARDLFLDRHKMSH
jgi:hypothetical protein